MSSHVDRSWRKLACILAALLVAGCGSGSTSRAADAAGDPATEVTISPVMSPGPGDHEGSVLVDGEQRTFTMHAPPSYDGTSPLPLVIAMHGRNSTAELLREMSGLDAVADSAGFLVVYPSGRNRAWDDVSCCGRPNSDVDYVRTLLDLLEEDWKIDQSRVYATGFSNGADMTFKLAAALPGTFAAIAPVSGGLTGTAELWPDDLKSAEPLQIITVVGSRDRIYSQIKHGLNAWLQHRRCSSPTQDMPYPKAQLWRQTSTCADGTQVVAYIFGEMSHSWPDGTGTVGAGAPAAGELMWEFFQQHPKP